MPIAGRLSVAYPRDRDITGTTSSGLVHFDAVARLADAAADLDRRP
ncbi:hypothetical protein [Streptomyces mirabilis]